MIKKQIQDMKMREIYLASFAVAGHGLAEHPGRRLARGSHREPARGARRARAVAC